MTTNVNNIERVIAEVNNPEYEFDMQRLPTCIIGATNRAAGKHRMYLSDGADYMGISDHAHWVLAFGTDKRMADGTYVGDATRADATEVLNRLIETGEVQWDLVRSGGGVRDRCVLEPRRSRPKRLAVAPAVAVDSALATTDARAPEYVRELDGAEELADA